MWLDPMSVDKTCRRSVATVEPRVAWKGSHGSETCGAFIEDCSVVCAIVHYTSVVHYCLGWFACGQAERVGSGRTPWRSLTKRDESWREHTSTPTHPG